MKIKKILMILGLSGVIFLCAEPINTFADSFNVLTLGENLTNEQKENMLKYFNVKEGTYELITVNNKEEREALKGIAPESEIGNRTISCSYVQPTKSGSGINVKTANLTWVTASMISNTLVTAGITDANVIAAAPFQVSGTGALTGILKGFEDSTGEKLDENKKELANKELVTTGDIAQDPNIGQEKAAAIVNDVKKEVIKDQAKEPDVVNKIINEVTNNYNITLPEQQKEELRALMVKIGDSNYDYEKIEGTLNEIGDNIQSILENSGQALKDSGFFDKVWNGIKEFFNDTDNKEENKDLGIINQTDNSALGDSTVVTSTDTNVEQSNSINSNNSNNSDTEEGIFDRLINWLKSLF